MAKGIRSNLIETEVKAQVVAAIQKVTTSMQTMMKSMEAQIDKLRKEMVWNRSMGVARQQRLPQEVVHTMGLQFSTLYGAKTAKLLLVTNFSSLHFMGRAYHWYQSYQMTI